MRDDRDPGLQGAEVLEAPAQARGAPERRRAPTDRGPAPVAPPREQQGPQAERPAAEQQPVSRRRRWLRWALFLLLPIVLIVGAYFYFEGGAYMTTDDAYVEADQVGLSTDVSGMVKSVDVKDNQQVTRDRSCSNSTPHLSSQIGRSSSPARRCCRQFSRA